MTNLNIDMPTSATILICSTVSPAFHEALPSRIAQLGRPDVTVIDCPVSGGTVRAADGTLTIFASGEAASLEKVNSLLHDMSEKLYIIPGGAGAASKVKMVNQLLVGTHIAAAAEAMALATKAGLNTREVYNIITSAAGNSWAFENRVPHMLNGDWTPHSALDIFVKDMVCAIPAICLRKYFDINQLTSRLRYLSAGDSCFERTSTAIHSPHSFGSGTTIYSRVGYGIRKRRRCRTRPSFPARDTKWSHAEFA